MRGRFFSFHTLIFFLTTSFLLATARPVFAKLMSEVETERQSASSTTAVSPRIDPQAWFAKGQTALQAGDLDAAEAAFRQVLVADPRAGSAYSNLGVIAMRRKNWDRAILLMPKAEKLDPKLARLRLTIAPVDS